MPCKGKKHCRSLPRDILTNLPDNVIDVILMCLPCKDAVRTSILSKKWRYHWCRLTELTLDGSLWQTKKDLLNPTVKFTKIICQILSLHEGPITKFTLESGYYQKTCPKIDNFIYFLSRNGIQHLVLCLPWKNPYKLPSSLFACSQLRHLTLYNCSIDLPSTFRGFDRLISLELHGVTISSKFLENLISRCSLLEQLVLVRLREMSEILNTTEIYASMLRSFEFNGSTSAICLKNVPLLEKVSGKCYHDSIEADIFGFAKFLESCPALEHLSLEYDFSKIWNDELDEVATRLPFDINSVKRFHLRNVMLFDSNTLHCALCLLRSFPYLEYLEIKIYREEEDDDDCLLESLELARFSDVTFNHLKEIKLNCFEGTTREMQLAKLLLVKSPALVRMLIDPWFSHEAIETRSIKVKELSNVVCASPVAEVVWL